MKMDKLIVVEIYLKSQYLHQMEFTVAIAVSNLTSPPPQIFNFQNNKVTR